MAAAFFLRQYTALYLNKPLWYLLSSECRIHDGSPVKPLLVIDLRDESVAHKSFTVQLLKATVDILWFYMAAV